MDRSQNPLVNIKKKFIALNIFDGVRMPSKRFFLTTTSYLIFWWIIHLKNICFDFVNDTKKQFSAIYGFCAIFECGFIIITRTQSWVYSHMGDTFAGLDSLYVSLTYHCIGKLAVCSHLASNINQHTDEQYILKLIKKHLDVLDLIKVSAKFYNKLNSVQLCVSFGAIATSMYNMKLNFEILLIVPLSAALIQLFFYFYVGHQLSSMNAQLQHSIYGSKWYEIKSISLKKKILFMLMMMQHDKGYSVMGLTTIMNFESYLDVMKQNPLRLSITSSSQQWRRGLKITV
ncbi:CLUMA_CG020752, isoform A [Clunio marinus]|uniref:CLUMA_CG020752, isoform A n=1 Tax=Clunio marinus TaxID=568069 RepID=A0A1J1J8L0_9DIPT|nr:CLUMA_CG020752, isoform A [Clunio marinus]